MQPKENIHLTRINITWQNIASKFKDILKDLMKKKIAVVFGTRPEAIKLAPVISGIKKTKFFELNICITAQHREMLDQVLKVFEIILMWI